MPLDMPNPESAWEHENGFYLTCKSNRLSKVIAHYELFQQVLEVPGAIVECGVFKGASLSRFAMMRALLGHPDGKKIVGFDMFDQFPNTDFGPDKAIRDAFVDRAGSDCISVEQMRESLDRRGIGENVELIAGDICETVPKYVADNPEFTISLLNLDSDIYEPAVAVLENLWDRILPGGVLILDDYGMFPGETKAVDDFFGGKPRMSKLPFAMSPCYMIKE